MIGAIKEHIPRSPVSVDDLSGQMLESIHPGKKPCRCLPQYFFFTGIWRKRDEALRGQSRNTLPSSHTNAIGDTCGLMLGKKPQRTMKARQPFRERGINFRVCHINMKTWKVARQAPHISAVHLYEAPADARDNLGNTYRTTLVFQITIQVRKQIRLLKELSSSRLFRL